MLFLATFLLSSQAMVASAATHGGTADMTNIETYLQSSYFNGYPELNSLDFKGKWAVTAIAHEAGHRNKVQFKTDGSTKFVTTDTSNYGEFKKTNFDKAQKNVFVTDTTDKDPKDVALDPFSMSTNGTGGANWFRVFELYGDSNMLDYLSTSIILKAGTIIVGFGDGQGDGDFDDMVLALKPVPVPAALFLFAPALLGFLGLRRKKSLAA